MLKVLRIFNIILIEDAEITFQQGLNVITGETGSGKSAIMHALGFIAGARGDSSLIRKGHDKGAVEAAFEIDRHSHIKELLEKAGIEHEPGNELIFRREININGKSRAFINNQMAQISLLKKVGDSLLGIVGQHANLNLQSTAYQRHIVNIYGELEIATAEFGLSWINENDLRKLLNDLKDNEAKRLRDIEVCFRELNELKEADLKEGEDEELFAEYSRLTNSEEIAQKAALLVSGLIGEKQAAIPLLQRKKKILDELATIDSSLQLCLEGFSNALLEIEEIAHTLTTYHGRIEYNPERILELNERLGTINTLKRRYGSTISEIHSYQSIVEQKLFQLQNTDVIIENLAEQLEKLAEKNRILANALTQNRKLAAAKFEKQIVEELRTLNMPKVKFEVEITPQKRDLSGDDSFEFFLSPNFGENKMPLKNCASGGELSRMLLALHAVLSGKEKTPTLVFDEIDANIGGETASIVGDKLKMIELKQQVICITHFPQVARQASHHLQISKVEKLGRTVTKIKFLSKNERQTELNRMMGGAYINNS